MAATSQAGQSRFTQADGVSLKEHFESRLAAIEKAMASESHTLERRLDSMNEVRAALGDLSNRMATREELGLQLEKLKADIADLKKSRDELAGKASQSSVMISLFLGAAGLALGVIGLLGGGG